MRIKIKQTLTFDYIEKLYDELYANVPSVKVDLEVPIKIEDKGFGLLPALFQFIATWLRNRQGKLVVPVRQGTDDKKVFACGYFGYYTLLMTWKSTPIVDEQNRDIKLEFREYTALMHKELGFMPQGVTEVLMPCFDHFSWDRGMSQWIYPHGPSFPDDEGDLDTTLYRALRTIRRRYEAATTRQHKSEAADHVVVMKNYDRLLGIFYELLRNTHEWARTDALDSVTLSPNGRGAFLKQHSATVGGLCKSANGHQGLIEFFNRGDVTSDTLRHYVELTVYDSGPGYARRYAGRADIEDETVDWEVDTIRKCLTKGHTSSTGIAKETKSLGLDRVLRLLDEAGGFLRIRTGRASVYRDLAIDPYRPSAEFNEVVLRDWVSSRKDGYNKMRQVDGAVITIVCPLN